MNFKTFCIESGISYKEQLVNHPYISKLYEIDNPDLLNIKAIPDGCIDIQYLWGDDCCKEFICGSFITGMDTPTGEYKKCFGAKLHPGVSPRFLGMPVFHIYEKKILCTDLANVSEVTEIEECLYILSSFEDRVKYLLHMTNYVVFMKNVDVVASVVLNIQNHQGYISIPDLVTDHGYSHQHLNRLFNDRVGCSVKKYCEIIRIQNAIHLLHSNQSLSDELYEKLGYYDQSHFINSFKKYTTITPKHYLHKNTGISIV